MTDDQIGALIAVNGLLSQLAGAILLVGLFTALLRTHPRPQPYFRQWTFGWAALVVALGGVAIQYAFPQAMAAEPLVARAAARRVPASSAMSSCASVADQSIGPSYI